MQGAGTDERGPTTNTTTTTTHLSMHFFFLSAGIGLPLLLAAVKSLRYRLTETLLDLGALEASAYG
jgi:hypothetical protein